MKYLYKFFKLFDVLFSWVFWPFTWVLRVCFGKKPELKQTENYKYSVVYKSAETYPTPSADEMMKDLETLLKQIEKQKELAVETTEKLNTPVRSDGHSISVLDEDAAVKINWQAIKQLIESQQFSKEVPKEDEPGTKELYKPLTKTEKLLENDKKPSKGSSSNGKHKRNTRKPKTTKRAGQRQKSPAKNR